MQFLYTHEFHYIIHILYFFTHPNAFLININYKINHILFNQLMFVNNDLII